MPGWVRFSSLAVLGGLCCPLAVAQVSGVPAQDRAAADTLVAVRDGPARSASDAKSAPIRSSPASAPKTVAERKSETLEAMRKGQLVPAGHGSPVPSP